MVLQVAGREGSQHQRIIELALGEGGLGAELHLVALLKARGRVGVGREALVILQRVGSFLAQGIEALLRQVAVGEVGTCPELQDLLYFIFPLLYWFVGVDAPPLHAHTGYVVELLRVLDDTEGADVDTAEAGQLAQLVQVVLHAAAQVGFVGILVVVRERYAQLLGLIGSPVEERAAVAVVGRKEGRRGAGQKVVVLALDKRGIHAHQHLAEGDVGLGERPEERLLIGHARRAHGEAANHVLAGGRRCDDRLVGLLTGRSQLRHGIIAEGANHGHHVLPVSQ